MSALVLDRFRIIETLGSGGFGTVYRAWDERLQRPVALKAIDAGPPASRRVLREAQAVARLNHPGIVTLYELGEEDGRAFLVSELVEGETLAALARQGMLSDRDVAEIGAELCHALAHAHGQGVIHRDIKPHNVIVSDGSGRAKLLDFGIARLVGDEALTATGDVVGTIAYMAPEQAEGEECGPPADAYSLALTLYECWAGWNPVARATPAATARAIGDPIPPLGAHRPDLPGEMAAEVDACLTSDPAIRPSLDALRPALAAAAPALDSSRAVPRPRRPGLSRAVSVLDSAALAVALPAFATAALAIAGLIWAGGSPPAWAYVLPIAFGALGVLLPRLAFLCVAVGLVAWLADAGRPGAGLFLAAVAVPAPLLLPRSGRLWCVPAIAPLLGAIGLAPLYLAVAGLSGTVGRRVALAALGYAWLTATEVALGTTLLLGDAGHAAPGWDASVGSATSAAVVPAISVTVALGLGVWVAAALLLGLVARGRDPIVDLLGALVWAAGVLAAHRLIAPSGAAVLPPAWLGGALLALIAIAIGYRALRAAPAESDSRLAGSQLGKEGGAPTLS